MKRLTINRLASAGIRANKRGYAALAVGVMLSIFFITTLCLLFAGVIRAADVQANERTGWQDAFFLDGDATDAELVESGYFTEDMGHVYLTGKVEGYGNVYLGHYDETAARMLSRKLAEGRFPETPGEIALERSALEVLRLDADLGDAVTWTITPVDGLPEERHYTIVGILTEQTSSINVADNMSYADKVLYWPQILTCPEEPAFQTGRLVQHRLLMLAPGVSANATLDDREQNGGILDGGAYAVMRADGSWQSWSVQLGGGRWAFLGDSALLMRLGDQQGTILSLILLMAVALVLGTAVGISGAMESTLSRRRETIGMLRAVGATKRQIRRIYGRESWLIALITAPLAMGLACLLVWVVSRLLPQYVAFVPSPYLLLPVLVLTLAVILLASSLPLRRASQVMPMSVMRDTAMLRKQKRIKTKKQFKVHRLIARRKLLFQPTRQIGAVLLMGLLIMVVGLAGIVGMEVWTMADQVSLQDSHAVNIWGDMSGKVQAHHFASIEPTVDLTPGDLSQIRALPLVDRVAYHRDTKINLLVTDVPEYLYNKVSDSLNYDVIHLNDDPQYEEIASSAKQEHQTVQQLLNTEKTFIPMAFNVMAIDPELAELSSGRVDLDALNEGREVLVFAPTYYYKYDADYGGSESSVNDDQGRTDWDYIRPNDYFTAGMEVDLAQFWCYDTEWDWSNSYENLHKQRVTAKVGGVLCAYRDSIALWDPTIITTEEGAQALGLTVTSFHSAKVYLSDLPDQAGEETLMSRIETIAMRGNGTIHNLLKSLRDQRQRYTTVFMVFAAIALVLFAVAVGMISGSITRSIRADVRLIGTLRAVGADAAVLRRCYTGSLGLTTVLGTVIGVAAMLGVRGYYLFVTRSRAAQVVPIALCLLLAAGVAMACTVLVRLRIREITNRTIVENIREL